jgi:hypothetical protein
MAKKHDTDTQTRIDPAPDAPTLRQDFAGGAGAGHRLEPRAYSPLRVCPQCSLAWETSGRWCPSCGAAFERENDGGTRVATSRPGGPPLRRQPRTTGTAFGRALLLAAAALIALSAAFFAGQASRPSQAQVDRSIEQAVNTAKQSAAASYRKAFDQMQAEAAAAIEAARKKGVAEGQASVEQQLEAQQQEGRSIFDSVTACVLDGDC